jgi:transposase
MKLFILEVSVNKAYKELGIAHNTAHKIYKRIRECIYTSEDDELLGGEVEMDESYFGGKERGEEVRKVKSLSLAYFQGWKSKSRGCERCFS